MAACASASARRMPARASTRESQALTFECGATSRPTVAARLKCEASAKSAIESAPARYSRPASARSRIAVSFANSAVPAAIAVSSGGGLPGDLLHDPLKRDLAHGRTEMRQLPRQPAIDLGLRAGGRRHERAAGLTGEVTQDGGRLPQDQVPSTSTGMRPFVLIARNTGVRCAPLGRSTGTNSSSMPSS
jgi:hypothetical protein